MKANKALLIGFVTGALLSGATVLLLMKHFNAKSMLRIEQKFATEHAVLLDSVRQSGLMNLMGPLLEKIEKELDQSGDRSLSDETISQLRALSEGFKPYAYVREDQLITDHFSPERGQLLLLLKDLDMDTLSWKKVMSQVTFSTADLKGAEMSYAYFPGIDLSNANLTDANLEGTNLKKASLRFANLWGANLKKANLINVDATRTDLSWADLFEATADSINLDGANLTSANLRNARVLNATFHWSTLNSTTFHGANLTGSDLLGAMLEKTIFTNTNLERTNFVKSVIYDADMTNAVLDNATILDTCWLSRLEEYQVAGAADILEKYHVYTDTSDQKISFVVIPNK